MLCVVPFAVADESAIAFKGYYKNLLTHSRTIYPADENFTLDLNRLRIEAQGQPSDWLSYDVQYDNEVFLGSYLDTAQFQLTKTLKPNTLLGTSEDQLPPDSRFPLLWRRPSVPAIGGAYLGPNLKFRPRPALNRWFSVLGKKPNPPIRPLGGG